MTNDPEDREPETAGGPSLAAATDVDVLGTAPGDAQPPLPMPAEPDAVNLGTGGGPAGTSPAEAANHAETAVQALATAETETAETAEAEAETADTETADTERHGNGSAAGDEPAYVTTVGALVLRRAAAVAVVVVAALAVVVLWARPAHEPLPPATAPASQAELNPTDLAFLQLMISLDSSALPLFDLMRAEPALRTVADTGAAGHRSELASLRAALAAGRAVEDPSIHAGHDLPGMVLDADLAAIRAAPADQRPAKALAVLRDHLTGTTSLAASEGRAGRDPATKAAAVGVLAAHARLLATLPAT